MNISINNHKFTVKTMVTQKDTQKGMMGKDFDSTFNGMLFLMDYGQHCFWMKNCIIPLDIIFIKDGIADNFIPEVSVESLLKHPSVAEGQKLFDEIKDWHYLPG
jgi:hypothetical protein